MACFARCRDRTATPRDLLPQFGGADDVTNGPFYGKKAQIRFENPGFRNLAVRDSGGKKGAFPGERPASAGWLLATYLNYIRTPFFVRSNMRFVI